MFGCFLKFSTNLLLVIKFSWFARRKLNNVIRADLCLQVTALDLIKHEEFSHLSNLLKQEFSPLSRLLLLLGWTQCRSLSSSRTLLSVLHLEQVPPDTTQRSRGVSSESFC